MKGCVQWNFIYGLKDSAFSRNRTGTLLARQVSSSPTELLGLPNKPLTRVLVKREVLMIEAVQMTVPNYYIFYK